MPRTRKSHPPSLKAKAAIEAIKAHTTTAQIAQMFGVHPTQVGGWKRQALAGLPDIFSNGRDVVGNQVTMTMTASTRATMLLDRRAGTADALMWHGKFEGTTSLQGQPPKRLATMMASVKGTYGEYRPTAGS